MDNNEDEEAGTERSPPLHQDLSNTASASQQCDPDPQSLPNAEGGDVITAELCEEEGNAVDAGTSTENKVEEVPVVGEVATGTRGAVVDTMETVAVSEEREISDLANEGEETQVRDDDKGNETVEDVVASGMDDAEKGNGSGLAAIIEGNGNDRTHVDDVAVETGQVEEDAAAYDSAHEADTEIGPAQTTEDEIRDEEAEASNEAALMEQEEQEQEQEQADAGGGMAQDTETADLIQEEDEEGRGEEEAEDEDGDGDGGMAEDNEADEEIEVTEELSASVSGGKRKRAAGKNSKSTGRALSRKKMEEDVCFICFDGGDLVLCDRR